MWTLGLPISSFYVKIINFSGNQTELTTFRRDSLCSDLQLFNSLNLQCKGERFFALVGIFLPKKRFQFLSFSQFFSFLSTLSQMPICHHQHLNAVTLLKYCIFCPSRFGLVDRASILTFKSKISFISRHVSKDDLEEGTQDVTACLSHSDSSVNERWLFSRESCY